MQFYIKRADLYAKYKKLDSIHSPSIYKIKPHESKYIKVENYIDAVTETKQIPSNNKSFVKWSSPIMRDCERKNINNEIRASYKEIQGFVAETSSKVIPCTQAHNRKCSATTIEDEKEHRGMIARIV